MGVHPTQIDTNVVKTIIKQPIWEWYIQPIKMVIWGMVHGIVLPT